MDQTPIVRMLWILRIIGLAPRHTPDTGTVASAGMIAMLVGDVQGSIALRPSDGAVKPPPGRHRSFA